MKINHDDEIREIAKLTFSRKCAFFDSLFALTPKILKNKRLTSRVTQPVIGNSPIIGHF